MRDEQNITVRDRIVSVEHIRSLANEKRSCYCTQWRRHMPAAIFLHMPAFVLLSMIDNGYLYIYPKPSAGWKPQMKDRVERKRKISLCVLPAWCAIGNTVNWFRSGQNHVIMGIGEDKVFFTRGNDYSGFLEWVRFSRISELKPVKVIMD